MQAANIWAQSLFPSLTNYVVMMVYLMIMFMWAFHVQRNKRDEQPAYQYFAWGLFAKVTGAIALCMIYTLYYEGGDTTGYFVSSRAMANLLMENPGAYFRILLGDTSPEALSAFSNSTGYPMYRHDISSFNIVRYTSLFTILGFQDYYTTSILFSWFFYMGYWKLYLLMVRIYPRYYKVFAFSVLFFPSVIFWGSGILKDTVALSMTGWFLYAFYFALIVKEKVFVNTLAAFLTGFVLISVKAYIVVALVPGVLIWLGWNYIKKFDNIVVRLLIAPLITGLFLGIGLGMVALFGEMLGEYGSIDGILKKAIITYEDHSRSAQYGHNYYDLGHFDGTLPNFIAKAPAAITAGLFRPFLWEVRNPVMLLAALENLAFLIMMIVIIWRSGLIKTIQIAFDEPMVIFALSFAFVFAFAVGVSSANFGALVRLKIPLIPFLGSALFILYYRSQEIKGIRDSYKGKPITTQLN